MPRNAATNSSYTEAERLPIQIAKTKLSQNIEQEQQQAESKIEDNFLQQNTDKSTSNTHSETSISRRSVSPPSTSFKVQSSNTILEEVVCSDTSERASYIYINSDSDCDSISNSNSPLYPAVIELTTTGGTDLDTLEHPSSSGSTITTSNVNARQCTLCTKLPSFIKPKRKPRPKSSISGRDQIRLASLRARKNFTAAGEGDSNRRKKAALIKNLPVAQTLSARLLESEVNKIEVLEFEDSKSGSGSSGGTKRKRNNSLTTASLSVTTRKRAATVKSIPLHTVEPKGGSAGGNTATANTMSLYERRYQAATAADESGRVGGTSNGYLSSTRSSSASSGAGVLHSSADNGLTADVAMETQYYLATGGNSTASSSLATASMPLSNGGVGGGATSAVSTINHAPSMATLCNIGNSCYLNSVVYTLRFAPRFLHNLHHLIVDLATVQQNIVRHRAKSASLGRGINAAQLENSASRSWSNKDLASLEQYNSSNAAIQAAAGGGNGACASSDICKSRHQLLTEKLHELFQSLHRNEVAESTEPHHADKLLHAIQDVNAIFEGNQQQDAHEFLMCVLNSIRETCQTLIKMIADCPELISEGNIMRTDEVDGNEKDLNAATGSIMNAANASQASSNLQTAASIVPSSTTTAQSSSSPSTTSNFTKTSFFSRKSKRKEEAKSAKNFRLQSPLKDAAANSSQQQQTIANSHFYLNSVDLSSANTATTTTAAASSPTSATAPSCASQLTNSASSDTSDSAVASPNPIAKQRLAEKIRELGLDFFSEDFEGITVATTKCLSCETVTEQKESMIDIAVPVPISGYDSSDYTEKPSAFIQNSCITREYFRGENKYRCEQCTGYTEAIRSISYEVLPRLLVIQLSRFSGGMEKINSYIPTSFTLQCFCSKCCELSDANKLHIYKLYSVITHVGATMSVGHYIAYTCSLDRANEYVNCPKDRRAAQAQQQQQQSNGLIQQQQTRENNNSSTTTTTTSAASAAASVLASSGTSLMKKMKFGRSKASSSGDISKNFKNLNGMTNAAAAAVAAAAAAAAANSQSITNGISKLSMNTTCYSLNCCATRLSTVQHQQYQQQQQQQYSMSDLSEESAQNGANHNVVVTSSSSSGGSYASYSSGYGSTGRGGTKATPFAASSNGTEPLWYMCDDDKIKAMTQREFEELLSPSRKITITPYLLFYARFDLQQTTTTTQQQSGGSSNQTTMPQSQTTMSWSNENLQSDGGGLHKI